jgi:hypothetical protein
MKEAQHAARYVKAYIEGANRDAQNPFADYQLMCEQGIDVLEDALDGFWEYPLAFALLVHERHLAEMVDIFAGRIYNNQPSQPIQSFRKLLKRERNYDSEDIYSLPIGSRYQPEYAPLWVEETAG